MISLLKVLLLFVFHGKGKYGDVILGLGFINERGYRLSVTAKAGTERWPNVASNVSANGSQPKHEQL